MIRYIFSLILLFLLSVCNCVPPSEETTEQNDKIFEKVTQNAALANEALVRSQRYMTDWLPYTDPHTGLLPRNLTNSQDIWNPWDSAADNYPFLVITSYFTNPELYNGQMQEILLTETALTSRIDRLPDQYSFTKRDFVDDEPDLDRIMFGSAEYIKDGLITIVELTGPANPWYARLIGILDDMWNHAPINTPSGSIISTNYEVNGEILQILSRIYWITQDEKYLEYGIRLADYYLLGGHHPTRDFEQLRLRDHGGEIIAGLSEIYATLHHAHPEKAQEYRDPLYEMLDRVLEAGRNEDGLFYNVINPQTGEVLDERLADTWGYLLNAYYTVYQSDQVESYRNAVLDLLNVIPDYQDYDWERGSADGDADAIEGTLYLYNREPVPSAAMWMDQQIQTMWSKQDSAYSRFDTDRWRDSGVIEGWHGDGNFARTSVMYALWKTQGISVQPWQNNLFYGAVQQDDKLYFSLSANEGWAGKLYFDRPRHREWLNLPFDWPRINQFSEWFTVESDQTYTLLDLSTNDQTTYTGEELSDGIRMSLEAGQQRRYILTVIEDQ